MRTSAYDVRVSDRESYVRDRIDGARTFKAALYERLAEMIRELELPPGARLVEADLSKQLSLSKTPIREALLLLERDGLVEMVPHTGSRVSWPSVAEYADINLVLDAIEQPSLPAVISHLSAGDIDTLGQILKRCEQARADRDSKLFFDFDLDYHKLMFGRSRTRWTAHLVETTLLHARRYERVFIHKFDDTWDTELGILSKRLHFVRRHDVEKAATVAREGHRRLVQLFQERSDHPLVAPFIQPQGGDQILRTFAGAHRAERGVRQVAVPDRVAHKRR
jgi:GntR family transcriptional regulator, rspAB operon transcriptional repressor